MPSSSPNALERSGAGLFEKMAMPCSWNLNHTPLTQLNPDGAYARGDHLEVDYLLPLQDVCLVGEITDRRARYCPEKLKRFQRHLNSIDQALQGARSQGARNALWRTLGVLDEDLRLFRNVRRLLGFAILTSIEKCEIPPQDSPLNTIVLYRYDWDLLQEYANTIGHWAQHPFLDVFGIQAPQPSVSRPLRFSSSSANLISACDRFVTADREESCHVVTFLASPYDVLPYASVCRRDALPSLGSQSNNRYQRTLFPAKLGDIRNRLLNSDKFMFPNSILVVLSKECSFDPADNTLEIQDAYGSLYVVDGQHRLFSYADETIRRSVESDARLSISAVVFDEVSDDYIERFSARTFIEINTNQTRVSSLHLYGIGYELLGDSNHKYLAAHILRKVNERDNPLRGLLRTSDSPRGRIKTMEIVGSLGVITNTDKMARLAAATSPSARRRRQGFESLFDRTVTELSDPAALVSQGVMCVERYFRLVARIFSYDWPKTSGPDNGSALSLTKFFAAFVRLLRQFAEEGADWRSVECELKGIRDNVKTLRRRARYKSVLFKRSEAKIPDATARISDMFRFLNANRSAPTSMSGVLRQARR